MNKKLKILLFNVLGLIIVMFLLLFLSRGCLSSYTNHNQSVTVPDIKGVNTEEAISILEKSGFRYEIIDVVFDNRFDKGTVVEQNPKAEARVKEGKKIYLIVNSTEDEMISMPQLTGISMRQVTAIAESYGLTIGNLKYIPDIAKNVVIRQLINGNEVEEGKKIKKGQKIDLVIGLGLSDKTTTVPHLIGKTYKEAYNNLLDLYLNIGAVSYDNSVKTTKDSLKAKIYKQNPSHDTIKSLNLGYNVDIWLTVDESLINND